MRPVILALLTAVVALPRLATAQPTAEDSAIAAILAPRFEQWMTAYERADAAGVAALFMEDGIYAANTGQVLRGREEIRTGIEGWIQTRPPGVTLDLRRETIRVRDHESVAHELVRFTILAVEPNCLVDTGHALSVWRRQSDDTWFIETLLVNRDPSPPPNACSLR
jgi:uncharacterized protein (TIGR02246 family)